MEISEVKIRSLFSDPSRALRAVVSVTFDNEFVVHDIKVIEGSKGLFVAMPSRPTEDGFCDVAHPIRTETRRMIEAAIFSEYKRATDIKEA